MVVPAALHTPAAAPATWPLKEPHPLRVTPFDPGQRHVTATIQARPTLYKGIRMRSRLEADYAAHLDRTGVTWQYEPECFASADGQWLPDFSLQLRASVLVELKPAGLFAKEMPGTLAHEELIDQILKRMLIARASQPDAVLQLVFWEYGADDTGAIIQSVADGAPWVVYARIGIVGSYGCMPLLWTGMGQYDNLRAR